MRQLLRPFLKKAVPFLLLLGIAAGIGLTTVARAVELLPVGIGYSLDEEKQSLAMGSTFAELAIAERENEENLIIGGDSSFFAQAESEAGAPYQDQVKVVLANDGYDQFHDVRLISGSMISAQDPRVNTDAALISKDLAVDMYLSTDVVGSTLRINGTDLTIVGVFEPGRSMLERICSDGYEQVIIPYSTLLPGVPESVQHIYVRNVPSEEKNLPPKRAGSEEEEEQKKAESPVFSEKVSSVYLSELDASLNGKLALYEQTDYTERNQIAAQYGSLIWFTLGLIFIVFLIRVSVISLNDTGLWAIGVHKSVERLRVGALFKRLIFPAALLLVAAAVFWLVRFEIYVPATIIPPGDRILHFSYYLDQYVRSFQLHTTGAADAFYRNVIFYGANLASMLMLAAAVFEIILLAQSRKVVERLIRQRSDTVDF